MEKKNAWVALFTKKPKKGTDFEKALSVIVGDKEPDADVDAVLDDAMRDRIDNFLMDPNAFIQANSSDLRVLLWRRMVPPSAPAPAQQNPVTTEPVAASIPNPASEVVPDVVVLPTRRTGLDPNALTAAARAATAASAAPVSMAVIMGMSISTPSATQPAPAQPQPAAVSAQPQPAAQPTLTTAATPVAAPATTPATVSDPTPATAQPAATTRRSRARPVPTPVTTAGNSWVSTLVVVVSLSICFISCLFVFKWVILDALKYADMSANDGLHREHPSRSEPEESPP